MSGNNMESLLMGGDDSSSGESDDEEVNVPTGTATTAASAVTVTAPPPAAAAPPPVSVSVPPPTQSPAKPIPVAAPIAAPAAPAPAPVIAPPVPAPAAAPPAKSSQADQMARLKSLYSISKSTASSNANTNANSGTGSSSGPGTPSTPTAPKISQPPPQQQQAPQQQRQQQTTTQHAPTQYQNPQHKPQVYQQSQPPQQSNQRQQQQPQSRQPQQPPPQQEMHPPSRLQPQQRPQQPQQQPQQYSQSSSQRTQYSQQQKQQPQPQQTHHQRPSSSQPAQQHQQQQQQQMQHRQQVHRRGNVQHSSRSTSSQPQQLHQAAAVVDPFAPTPLSQIKQSNQHRSRTHHQQQQQPGLHQQPTQPSPRMPQQVVGGSSSSGGNSSRERDIKKQKEKFLMFTRVLIKYLEQKDKRMHHQAKIIIKDCAERNKRQEPGYESVTESMKRRLKELVGDHYWKKANDYLIHFIEQKRRQHAAAAAGGSSSGGGSRSSGGSSSSAQQQQQQQLDAHKRRRLKEQEDRERLRLQSLEKERLKKDQASKQRTAVASPLVAIQQEIQEKREQITMQTAKVPTSSKASKSKSAARSTAAAIAANTTAATKGKGGGTKKAPRRKSVGESSTVTARRGSAAGSKTAAAASATAAAAAPVKRVVVEEPPREYKELMELIDHAVDYDWPSVGQLLGAKSDLKLTEEEHLLLYGDLPEPSAKTKKRTSISKTSGKTPQGQDVSVKIEGQLDKKVNREVRPGWGRSNVLSARSAWARVRLRELKIRKRAASNPSPIVAGGLLSLSTSVARDQQLSTSAAAIPIVDAATSTTSATKPEIEGYWVNEETAEQDAALSLLSAGCQIYLKGVLQKTIQCARQRQNLDGIRLWHQQYTFSKGTSTTSSNINSTALNLSKDDKSKKPPLSLRLGCDVSRQVAQAQGNAAMTVKRMEEALERQTGIPMRARELNNDTLQEATSMGDLSWRPLLKEGAEKAEYQAKRSFEVFGGKEAKDPPLGRVPKKAKLQVEDLLMGSELSIGGPYHKAYTASSFISF